MSISSPPDYYQSASGLMVTHALGHMMYGLHIKYMSYHEAIGGMVITGEARCLLHVYYKLSIYNICIINGFFLYRHKG